MPTVYPDLIDGPSLELGEDGYTVTRTFIVEGLTGNAHRRLYDATTASGIPRRGDAHPSIPGIRCDTLTASPEQRDTKVRVVATYRALDADSSLEGSADVALRTSLTTKETDRDKDGHQMRVVHNLKQYDENGNRLRDKTIVQIPTASVQRPLVVYTVTRKEKAPPLRAALRFVGSTGRWSGGLTTWLCSSITANTSDGGRLYDVTYEFTHDPAGWRFEATVYDENGQVYPGASIKVFDVYPGANFSELNVPPPPER